MQNHIYCCVLNLLFCLFFLVAAKGKVSEVGQVLDLIKEPYLCFILQTWEYLSVMLFEDKDEVNVPKYILNYNGEKLSYILIEIQHLLKIKVGK